MLVLHLWRDGDGADAWRASLTDVRTRQVKRFADLHALTLYLGQNLSRQQVPGPATGGPDTKEE